MSKKKPLTLNELKEKPVSTKIVAARERRGFFFIDVECNGEIYSLGFRDTNVLKEVLKDHGWMEEDGSKYIEVPPSKLVRGRTSWINEKY